MTPTLVEKAGPANCRCPRCCCVTLKGWASNRNRRFRIRMKRTKAGNLKTTKVKTTTTTTTGIAIIETWQTQKTMDRRPPETRRRRAAWTWQPPIPTSGCRRLLPKMLLPGDRAVDESVEPRIRIRKKEKVWRELKGGRLWRPIPDGFLSRRNRRSFGINAALTVVVIFSVVEGPGQYWP